MDGLEDTPGQPPALPTRRNEDGTLFGEDLEWLGDRLDERAALVKAKLAQERGLRLLCKRYPTAATVHEALWWAGRNVAEFGHEWARIDAALAANEAAIRAFCVRRGVGPDLVFGGHGLTDGLAAAYERGQQHLAAGDSG